MRTVIILGVILLQFSARGETGGSHQRDSDRSRRSSRTSEDSESDSPSAADFTEENAIIQKYCQDPYGATCGSLGKKINASFSQSVEEGDVDEVFFRQVRKLEAKAIATDPALKGNQEKIDAMQTKLNDVHMTVGNQGCDPNRPSARAQLWNNTIYVCLGMIEKARKLGAAEGKGPRSFMFHVLAHELGHFMTSYTKGIASVVKNVAKIAQFSDESIPDYWADRAAMVWQGTKDPLTQLNAATDALQLLCSMSQLSDHPLHRDRARLIRRFGLGQKICAKPSTNPTPKDSGVVLAF